MLQPTDFWRAAKYLISRYGIDAGDRAGRRAAALRDQGDPSGHKTWHVLAVTISELQMKYNPMSAHGQAASTP